MTRSLWPGFLGLMLVCGSASAGDGPRQFENPLEMFEEFNDFIAEDGTLRVVSTEPLHLTLVERTFPGQPDDVTAENLQRTVIYGLYRPFIHTDVEEITITAIAGLVLAADMEIVKLLESTAVTVTMTRQEALQKARQFCPVDDLGDLVADLPMGDFTLRDEWTTCFEALMYNDAGGPGLKRFFKALIQPTG